jgi:hypothetical protein
VIAALPMYDLPHLRGATDRLWKWTRAALGAGPEALTRDRDLWEIWQHPDLILAQTCGLPYRMRLHGRVTLVGTPDYGVAGCPPGYYRSVMVARGPLPARPVLAVNDGLSQSGWAAPAGWLAAKGIEIGGTLATGAHSESARAVAEGRADLAGIDAVTWRLLGADRPAGLVEIGRTEPTPGLPVITATGRDPLFLAAALRTAITALAPADRAALGLKALVTIPAETYLALPPPPPVPVTA